MAMSAAPGGAEGMARETDLGTDIRVLKKMLQEAP